MAGFPVEVAAEAAPTAGFHGESGNHEGVVAMKSDHSGFTLLELLIVITISAALVILLGQLYRLVGKTSFSLFSANDDWVFEQFLRKQLWFSDQRFFKLGLRKYQAQEIIFASRLSARYGQDGPPVLVRYRYEPSSNALLYTEVTIPPWWAEQYKSLSLYSLFHGRQERFQETALSHLDNFSFSFFDGQQWHDKWLIDTAPPNLIKLRFQRTGDTQEMLLETRALFFSTPSGF